MIELKRIEDELAGSLSINSFEHCVRTKLKAIELAEAHGADIEKTATAALLHDYARDLNNTELLDEAVRNNYAVNQVERNNPYLLHAPVGAILVKRNLGIEDDDILNAIRRHTYGDVDMKKIDLIVYLADLIEPGRTGISIEEVRGAALIDLERSFKIAYQKQVEGLLSKGKYLHPLTVRVWNNLIDSEKDNGRTRY